MYTLGAQSPALFVQPFPGPGARQQIASGGSSAVWRGDGKEILYFAGDGVMSISVTRAGNDLHFSEPRLLFSGLRKPPGFVRISLPLAVSADGPRIFWPQAPEAKEPDIIHVRMGWMK